MRRSKWLSYPSSASCSASDRIPRTSCCSLVTRNLQVRLDGSAPAGAGPSAEGSAHRENPFAVGVDGEMVNGPAGAANFFPPANAFKLHRVSSGVRHDHLDPLAAASLRERRAGLLERE